MKRYFVYIILLTFFTLQACEQTDFDTPDTDLAPYGNNDIAETGVISIAELKQKFAKAITDGDTVKITDDIKIRGRVTGNDIQGNIYNEISLQDTSGAIIVCISQSGIYSYLPFGTEILVDLNGLYIGGYGQMAEIGMPYTSSAGKTYVSRMSKFVWQQHFKITDAPDTLKITPLEFSENLDIEACAGMLVVLKNVSLKDANGSRVYAPSDGSVSLSANCANRLFSEYSNNVVLRTSTYADFASSIMPSGKLNITGVATRYNTTWQILLRTVDDVQPIENE